MASSRREASPLVLPVLSMILELIAFVAFSRPFLKTGTLTKPFGVDFSDLFLSGFSPFPWYQKRLPKPVILDSVMQFVAVEAKSKYSVATIPSPLL